MNQEQYTDRIYHDLALKLMPETKYAANEHDAQELILAYKKAKRLIIDQFDQVPEH